MDLQFRLTEEKLPQVSNFSLLINVIVVVVVFAFKRVQFIFKIFFLIQSSVCTRKIILP